MAGSLLDNSIMNDHYLKSCPICLDKKTKHVFTSIYCNQEYQVYRCTACNFDFVNNNTNPQDGTRDSSETPEHVLANYYESYEKDKKVASLSLDIRMPIFESFYRKKISKVLEIGCGPATAYPWFKKNNIAWNGFEYDKNALAKAKKLNEPVNSGDISEYTDEYELIYAHQVLEHITDPIGFMKNIHKALKSNGIVAIGVPNNNGFTAIFRRLFKKWYPIDYGFIQIPYHLRAYNKDSIEKVFKKSGFEVCSINRCTSFDRKYGEWYDKKNSFMARTIFNLAAVCGYGTLLYAIGRKKQSHDL